MNHIHDDSEGSQAELLKGGTNANKFVHDVQGDSRGGITEE